MDYTFKMRFLVFVLLTQVHEIGGIIAQARGTDMERDVKRSLAYNSN